MPSRLTVLIRTNVFGVLGCLLGMAVSGCAVVEVSHGDGTSTRSFVFASPVIAANSEQKPNIVKIIGLGLLASNNGATLGWFNESRIALDRNCRIVLVGNSNEQLRRFADLIGDTKSLCADSAGIGGSQ